MKSIYISGPYSAPDREGEDQNIRYAAAAAAEYLRKGYAAFCPHTMTAQIDRELEALSWEEWLIFDLYWLAKCDAIHMLPGWRKSKGAMLEYMAAKALGLEILGDV